MFNVVSWQCIAGPVLVLFGRQLDMPPAWVGVLMSFMPLSMPLVVVTVPLVVRFGPKRVMFTAWLLRNLAASFAFIMPWVLVALGPKSAWYVLLSATLGFCIMRALGVGGWFPWLHEVVPEDQRGKYFSAEISVAQLVNIGVAIAVAVVLAGRPGVPRFLAVYGVGVLAGLASLIGMWRVPGGTAVRSDMDSLDAMSSYRVALGDRHFMLLVVAASLSFASASWLGSAAVMYLRDGLRVPSGPIMAITAAASAGVMLTIQSWQRFADKNGSGRAMMKTLLGHSLAAMAILAFSFALPGNWMAIAVLIVLASVFSSAFSMAAHRAMLGHVVSEHRPAYTNLWTVGTALAGGITPILAGQAIDQLDLWGFRLCFFMSVTTGLGCALLCRIVVKDGAPFDSTLTRLLNPALQLRTVVRIAWVTMGLDETNR